jgi:hypothetical protein
MCLPISYETCLRTVILYVSDIVATHAAQPQHLGHVERRIKLSSGEAKDSVRFLIFSFPAGTTVTMTARGAENTRTAPVQPRWDLFTSSNPSSSLSLQYPIHASYSLEGSTGMVSSTTYMCDILDLDTAAYLQVIGFSNDVQR